jgi:putative ABC transport system substrate-binding protein
MAISTPDDLIVEALGKGRPDRGYFEGTNIKIEFRTALGRSERLPGLAEELVRLEPDVIFAVATPSINAVRRVTTTIPIVIALSGDPSAHLRSSVGSQAQKRLT